MASSSACASCHGLSIVRPFESISARQLLSVGERIELARTEPVVVEKLLPLPDHAEAAVVHDDDLDRQSV